MAKWSIDSLNLLCLPYFLTYYKSVSPLPMHMFCKRSEFFFLIISKIISCAEGWSDGQTVWQIQLQGIHWWPGEIICKDFFYVESWVTMGVTFVTSFKYKDRTFIVHWHKLYSRTEYFSFGLKFLFYSKLIFLSRTGGILLCGTSQSWHTSLTVASITSWWRNSTSLLLTR